MTVFYVKKSSKRLSEDQKDLKKTKVLKLVFMQTSLCHMLTYRFAVTSQ